MFSMALIKLIIIAAVLIISRIFFPTLVRGFKRIAFIIIVSLIIFAVVVNFKFFFLENVTQILTGTDHVSKGRP